MEVEGDIPVKSCGFESEHDPVHEMKFDY